MHSDWLDSLNMNLHINTLFRDFIVDVSMFLHCHMNCFLSMHIGKLVFLMLTVMIMVNKSLSTFLTCEVSPLGNPKIDSYSGCRIHKSDTLIHVTKIIWATQSFTWKRHCRRQ